MDLKKLSGILIITGGFFELLLGILHFIWPFNFLKLPDFNHVTSSARDFILLATLALGLCMTVFALLSFYFSKRIMLGEKSALFFCLSQVILWFFRLVFELLLPVKVPLFSIQNTSELIIVISIFIILIYLTPLVLLRKMIQTKQPM